MKIITMCCILTLCVSCTTMKTRIIQNEGSSWTPNEMANVQAGNIAIGMTKSQVMAATGIPDSLIDKRVHITTMGRSESWFIYKNMFGGWTFANSGMDMLVLIGFDDHSRVNYIGN